MDDLSRPTLVIVDANVLIDYWFGDRNLLRLISVHFAQILIPSAVLDEVEQLTRRTCALLKLEIIEPSVAQWTEAAQHSGKLSLEDRLCLMIASELKATCLTNDRRLRAECVSLGVSVLWSLEPLIYLVNNGQVSIKTAVKVVRKMRDKNPLITQIIFQDFCRKIGHQE